MAKKTNLKYGIGKFNYLPSSKEGIGVWGINLIGKEYSDIYIMFMGRKSAIAGVMKKNFPDVEYLVSDYHKHPHHRNIVFDIDYDYKLRWRNVKSLSEFYDKKSSI
jgi:hypothetical protein